MTANETSDGDRIEVPDGKKAIELDDLETSEFPSWSFSPSEPVKREYSVIAYPTTYEESEGTHGVELVVTTRFSEGNTQVHHSFSPDEARELAARLTAAADKLGHVPDDDAPQPAEL